MMKLETRNLEDLCEDQREYLESTYIDAIGPIKDAFRKEIEHSPENPGWALEYAVESTKGVPGLVRAYLDPVTNNGELRSAFSKLLDAGAKYASNRKPSKVVDEMLSYAHGARRLAKNASMTQGDFLVEAMANEEALSKDQVADMAYEIMLDSCLKKVDKDVVNGYLIDAGRKVISYGVKNMKDHHDYDKFVALAKEFNAASVGYKDPDMMPR